MPSSGATCVTVPFCSQGWGVATRYRLHFIAGLARSSQPWHLPCPSCLPWEGVGNRIRACVTLVSRWGRSDTFTPSPKAEHNTRWGIPKGIGTFPCRKKLYPPLVAGIGNGEAALLRPKSFGMGGDVPRSVSLAGPGAPGSQGCALSCWPRSSPTSPCPSSSASSPACSPNSST